MKVCVTNTTDRDVISQGGRWALWQPPAPAIDSASAYLATDVVSANTTQTPRPRKETP